MSFSEDILAAKKELEKQGHEVSILKNTEKYADNTINLENKDEKMQIDALRLL